MVAGGDRFHDRGRTTGGKPRQEKRALYLGAGRREHMASSLQPGSRHRQRGVAIFRLDPRAHASQRFDNRRHGPAAEGRVTVQRGRHPASREDAQHQAHGRPGVRAIECSMWRAKRSPTRAMDSRRAAAALDADAEAAEAGHRCRHILALGKPVNAAFALRQGRQYQGPVGNRLIAGDTQFTSNPGCRFDDLRRFHVSGRHARPAEGVRPRGRRGRCARGNRAGHPRIDRLPRPVARDWSP